MLKSYLVTSKDANDFQDRLNAFLQYLYETQLTIKEIHYSTAHYYNAEVTYSALIIYNAQ